MTPSPKLPGGPQPSEAAARRTAERHLVALTRDPALAQALQGLAEAEVSVHLVEDLRRFADELVQHAHGVALLDAQALSVPVDAAVDAVKNQFPEVRLMVAGHAAEQALLTSRISQQKVFRFVHKPASVQRLKLFLEAATQRHGNASTGVTAEVPVLSGAAQPPRGGVSPAMIMAAVAAAAVLAAGGWWMLRGEGGAPARSAPDAALATPQGGELMQRAASALAAGRYVASDGSSAAELYRQVLRINPGSDVAAEGFEQTIERALAGAEQALLAGELEQARTAAELVRLIEPDNSRLAFLYSQIERELARVNADATQRQAFEARQAQIRAAVALVSERIDSGALIEPANDSAVLRFRETQQLGGGDPLVRASRDALVAALLTAADRDLAAGRSATARRLVDAAGSVNSSAPGLDIMRRRLDEPVPVAAAAPAASEPAPAPAPVPVPPPAQAAAPTVELPAPPASAASAPATASEPVTVPAPATPPPPPAAPAPASSTVINAASLRTVRSVEPVYPQQALQQMVSGWVELEFTIEKDGSVRDVSVADSAPRRTFDSAAVTAIRRYRFEPILRDGEAVSQRARLRMRFAAEN